MEKKLTKNEKGITLVALIITIIVLLILAVISIRAITGDNILGKSETAKEKYESAKKDEADRLGDYSNAIQINEKSTSNSKYYRGILDGDDSVVKLTGNKAIVYMGKENGPYYKVSEGDAVAFNTKAKVNGVIHKYDRFCAERINDISEYGDDDIIIENVRYSSSSAMLISELEIFHEENKWYNEDKEESLMEDNSEDCILSLVENFDESLLIDELPDL